MEERSGTQSRGKVETRWLMAELQIFMAIAEDSGVPQGGVLACQSMRLSANL